MTLVFDESAAALPQNDIRMAVEHELGASVAPEPIAGRPTLRVSLAADGTLVLAYERPASTLERRLPNPQRPEQIPMLVSLAAVNLVRNQAAGLVPSPEPPSAPERAPPEPRAPPAAPQSDEPAPPVERQNVPASFRSWFGIHVGLDLVPMSTTNACSYPSPLEIDDVVCVLPDGTRYTGTPSNGATGSISGGLKTATVPVLVSFEHTFGSFGMEARAGYAFNGGPSPHNGSSFFPFRAEFRGKLWPLGASAPASELRPYLHLGAGVAQVDVTTDQYVDTQTEFGGPLGTVTIVKSFWLASFTAGGGATFAVADGHALVLDLNFMLLVPVVGFTIEPSIGYRFGI